jgi:hypothetical protein
MYLPPSTVAKSASAERFRSFDFECEKSAEAPTDFVDRYVQA